MNQIKLLLLLCLFVLSDSSFLMAQTPFPTLQDTTFLSNIITRTPTSYNNFKNTVGYEKAISTNKSVKLNGGITLLNVFYEINFLAFLSQTSEIAFNFEQAPNHASHFGYDITPSIRFYTPKQNKIGPQGFFVAPFFRYASYSLKINEDFPLFVKGVLTQGKWKMTYNAPFLGVMLGTQTIKQNRFVWGWHLGFGVGPGKVKISVKDIEGYQQADYDALEQSLLTFWTSIDELDNWESVTIQSFSNDRIASSQINFLSATIPFGVSFGYNF